MYKQEEIKPYGKEGEKGKLVEEMFDNIAPTYDTLNHRFNRKQFWILQRVQVISLYCLQKNFALKE